jgi:hypothetical protein
MKTPHVDLVLLGIQPLKSAARAHKPALFLVAQFAEGTFIRTFAAHALRKSGMCRILRFGQGSTAPASEGQHAVRITRSMS